MRLKNKKGLILVVCVMFTLTVSYFAVLSPTTAWFYTQSNKDYTFVFGDVGPVEMSDPESVVVPVPVTLKAATRCADFGENNFDAAIYVAEINAENRGSASARVWITPSLPSTPSGLTMDGLYFFATSHKMGEEDIPTVKEELEEMLMEKGVTPMEYSEGQDYLTYENNVLSTVMGGTDGYMNNAYVIVPPRTTSVIRIAFWVEYNSTIRSENVGTQFENNSADFSIDKKMFDNIGVDILLTAGQDGVGVPKVTLPAG